jgi:hypothetical protein
LGSSPGLIACAGAARFACVWVGDSVDPLIRTDETTSATTASRIVTLRNRRGVSHDMFRVPSQARTPDAAPTAVAAHIEQIPSG